MNKCYFIVLFFSINKVSTQNLFPMDSLIKNEIRMMNTIPIYVRFYSMIPNARIKSFLKKRTKLFGYKLNKSNDYKLHLFFLSIKIKGKIPMK